MLQQRKRYDSEEEEAKPPTPPAPVTAVADCDLHRSEDRSANEVIIAVPRTEAPMHVPIRRPTPATALADCDLHKTEDRSVNEVVTEMPRVESLRAVIKRPKPKPKPLEPAAYGLERRGQEFSGRTVLRSAGRFESESEESEEEITLTHGWYFVRVRESRSCIRSRGSENAFIGRMSFWKSAPTRGEDASVCSRFRIPFYGESANF